MENKSSKKFDAIVVGAGIAGLSAALELAETGFSVALVEKKPYVGGRVAQLNLYFPKMCPPTCGLEINVKRLIDNPLIELFDYAEIVSLEGDAGAYRAVLKRTPRYVKEEADEKSLLEAAERCPTEVFDDFNLGLRKRKPLYRPYNNSYPQKWVFDKASLSKEELKDAIAACGDVLDLKQEPSEEVVEAKAVILATGWEPYDAKALKILGYEENPNVITNMEMERLCAPNGPTGGELKIPGYDGEIKKVAIVQCAGSRDENHLEYCSSVCCLASMKHARYLRERLPEVEVHIFYIDIRSPGAFEDFYADTKEDEKVYWHRGKVAKIFKDWESGKLIVEAEDTLSGNLKQYDADLAILATGMRPTLAKNGVAFRSLVKLDENGFVKTKKANSIIGCGVATGPKDVAGVVQEATAAAIKAIHIIKGSK